MKRFSTTERPRQRLLVFARFPEAGKIKTRIAEDLGAAATLDLYRAMLTDLFARIGSSDVETEIEVLWTGGEEVRGAEVQAAFPGYTLAMQSGATLGDRLAMAFSERVLFHNASKIVAIGTDDLHLTRDFLHAVLDLLDSCEWVIGPANDGGFYLIGARGDSYRNSVFAGVEWGTSTVFETTLATIRRMKATVAILPMHSDIDTIDDLCEFIGSDVDAPNVRRVAEEMELAR